MVVVRFILHESGQDDWCIKYRVPLLGLTSRWSILDPGPKTAEKLTHKRHDQGKWELLTCRKLEGNNWGLKPKSCIRCLMFVFMVRPVQLHFATVLCPMCIALNCCLKLTPSDIHIKVIARRQEYQLQLGRLWLAKVIPGLLSSSLRVWFYTWFMIIGSKGALSFSHSTITIGEEWKEAILRKVL